MWENRLDELKALMAEGRSNAEIGVCFGVSGSTVRRTKNKLRQKGLLPRIEKGRVALPTGRMGESLEKVETKSSLELKLNHTRIKTLEELLAFCEVDTSIWEVERFIVNKWEVGAKNPEGEIEVEPLYQVKAFLKRRVVVQTLKTLYDDLKVEAKNYSPNYKPLARSLLDGQDGYCLELSIPDLHIGKLIWEQECGNDYDSDIAEGLFYKAIEDLLQKTSGYHKQLKRILLVVGNDLLNADNYEGTTTAGTPQHCDTRHQKMFKRARVMMQRTAERLSKFADVDVVLIPGNHDQQTVFYLGDVLEVAFENNPNIFVDNTPPLRKYYKFGDNLLMFTHGKNEKMPDLPLLMATEQPKLWGETKYREVHLGHHHRKSAFHTPSIGEHHGVRVRILPSLCPPDAWMASNGMTGNIRSAEAYVWHETQGLEAYFSYNL